MQGVDIFDHPMYIFRFYRKRPKFLATPRGYTTHPPHIPEILDALLNPSGPRLKPEEPHGNPGNPEPRGSSLSFPEFPKESLRFPKVP